VEAARRGVAAAARAVGAVSAAPAAGGTFRPIYVPAARASISQGQGQDRDVNGAGAEASFLAAAAGATVFDMLIYIYITHYILHNTYITYCLLITY
jgi:hypothetical protein